MPYMSLRCFRYGSDLFRVNHRLAAREAPHKAAALPDFNPGMVGRLKLGLSGSSGQLVIGIMTLGRFYDPVCAIDKEEAKVSHRRATKPTGEDGLLKYDAANRAEP